ncbi:TldD/PmbA family protein [Methanothermobacter thermautotrophicus]|jgi:TldD protein|uniref:TldD/PmbA family protein n=1 Tax=Methanothermobacter thermautotrophicus TaxID=145262 RepID=A0A842YS64_METTF|nr:TldD/PmbA family protein [Methanothermobacter thermautotrophicus]MBE2900505.1 TldD/PmbA family protein [Methanothermobacter thermautotrophicus]
MEIDIDYLGGILRDIEDMVEYADIRAGTSRTSSILMKDGNLQEVKSGSASGFRVRVLRNGSWGFAFTDEPSQLPEMALKAIKMAGSLRGDVQVGPGAPSVDKTRVRSSRPPSDVPADEKRELVSDAHHAASVDGVVSTTVSYVDMESSSVFLNSEGSQIEMDETRVALFLNAVASDGSGIQFGHKSCGGTGGFEILEGEDIEELGRRTGEKAVRLLRASPPPSGRFDIVTDPELTGVFIHEALGHAAEADLILQGDSILEGKLGERIASEGVTIIDDPTVEGFGSYSYDAEGVRAAETVLVEKGVLTSLLNSRETAFKLSLKPSGNARSAIGDQPIVRMSNTYLKPGDLSFDELIEDIMDGVYLRGSRGGQVDTGKGIFQFNAAESFRIRDGEVAEPVKDVSLSGNVLETLKNVDGVGSDFRLGIGFCGKSGQSVPVGDGGPHVRIRNAMVGGT